jgi:hypothetical protein
MSGSAERQAGGSNMMKSIAHVGGITGVALGLSACGTLYRIDVTAYNDPKVELEKTYVVLSGTPEIQVNSPEFNVYADQVERALAGKGYRRLAANELADAALGIYFSADIGDPSKRYHTVATGFYESPYAENPTSVVRSSGQNSGGQRPPPPPPPPPEALTGYEETGFATTVFTKHLNLVAVDLQEYLKDIAALGREQAVPREIWSIDIETTGKPADLMEAVPVMLAAGQPYLAESTDDVVQVKLSDSDSRVGQIKGSK